MLPYFIFTFCFENNYIYLGSILINTLLKDIGNKCLFG